MKSLLESYQPAAGIRWSAGRWLANHNIPLDHPVAINFSRAQKPFDPGVQRRAHLPIQGIVLPPLLTYTI